MDKTERNKDKKQEVLDNIIIQNLKENKSGWVVQPFNLTMLRGDMDKVSLSYIVNMMDALQERISNYFHRSKEQRDENPNLFTKEELENEKLPTIRIPLAAMGVIPQNYTKLEEATKIIVKAYYVFEEEKNGKKFDSYAPLFSKISIPRLEPTGEGKRAKRASYVEVKINPEISRYAFNMSNHHRYLKNVVFECNGKYAARIYLFINSNLYKGEWSIPYQDLRRLLYVDVVDNPNVKPPTWKTVKYPKYANFKQRILDASKKEIDRLAAEGKVDCTFTYEEEFPLGKREGEPSKIIFHIHQTEMGKKATKERELQKISIGLATLLTDKFKFTATDFNKIRKLAGFADVDYNELKQKVDSLEAYLDSHPAIESRKAYAIKAITAFLQERVPVAEEIKEPQSVVQETIADIPQWGRVVDELKAVLVQNDFDVWIKPIQAKSFVNNTLTLQVPSSFFAEYLEDNLIDKMAPVIRKVFGQNVKLEYKIG